MPSEFLLKINAREARYLCSAVFHTNRNAVIGGVPVWMNGLEGVAVPLQRKLNILAERVKVAERQSRPGRPKKARTA